MYYEPKANGEAEKCVQFDEYTKLIKDINQDDSLKPEQSELLRMLATRFIVFKYEKLADYYANTDSNMQAWLEKLRCAIVDNDSAIKNGYFEYLESYKMLLEDIVDEK